MFCRIKSGGVLGIDGFEVDVEVDVSPGIPQFNIVGLPDKAINEAKDRVRSALKNMGYNMPAKKITVNLSPSYLKKQGTLYDLPIAVGILQTQGVIKVSEDTVILGELSLDGKINKVSGVLPIVLSLKEKGYKRFFVPEGNAFEGAIVKGAKVYGFSTLQELVEYLKGEILKSPVEVNVETLLKENKDFDIDLSDIYGQELAKRAIEISCSGMHHLLLIGPPGVGKSMLAKRMITIMPPLTFEEAVEVTRIYSVAGLLSDHIIKTRPFRSPHHTASDVSLIGGGTVPIPGEISLAHRGILFLDEMTEFSKKTLEALRQPLEDGYVNITRANAKVRFPSEFLLVGAINPCPCGNYSNPYKACTCSPAQIKNYQSKLSGPILDRIDMKVWVEPVEKEELLGTRKGENSSEVRKRVERAFQIQRERFKGSSTFFNGMMKEKEIEKYCVLDSEAKRLLEHAMDRLHITGRSYMKILKVSRTVADLEGEEIIRAHHLSQALQFRVDERLLV
jgi:magnesium chelatase family protein